MLSDARAKAYSDMVFRLLGSASEAGGGAGGGVGRLEGLDECGEGGGRDGEGCPGRGLRVADGDVGVQLRDLHAVVAVPAAGVGRLPPVVGDRHDAPHSSLASRWMKSRERVGSSDTPSTLRRSVRKTSSWASESMNAVP